MVCVINASSQVLYKPTPADSKKTGESIDSLLLGRKLYINNCASCHSLYRSEKFTRNEWTKVMPRMQKKAKCTPENTLLILKYVTARAKNE